MIEWGYSLVIEATEEPDYFGFYSPDLEGFTGIGHSIEDCIYKAKWGMIEHINLLKEKGLPIPPGILGTGTYLCDVIMPKKNGREAYREIEKIKPEIKALFTSGYTADIIQKRGIIEKGVELILKPVTMTSLLQKVREVLDRGK
jgi:predicted RNase H-like HicB family nuclease